MLINRDLQEVAREFKENRSKETDIQCQSHVEEDIDDGVTPFREEDEL